MSNKQYGFYLNQNLCTGCDTCLVACKDWNDLKPGKVAYRKRIVTETGKFPNLTVYQVVMGCNHCENPACLEVCPVGAIKKRDDGVVTVNRDICIGCRACKSACPYDAPQFEEAESSKMQKCSMCWDRLASTAPANIGATSKIPACVAACPQRALDFGTIDDLMVIHAADGVQNTAPGFKRDEKVNPSILFSRKVK